MVVRRQPNCGKAAFGLGNYSYVTIGTDSFVVNYCGLSIVTILLGVTAQSSRGLSVSQAYDIDSKMDDGMPQSGRVIASFLNNVLLWADPTFTTGLTPYTTALAGSTSTCYDNGGVVGLSMPYSTTPRTSANNCAFYFK